ncbi:MAG: AAA family ATPase, partial [Anaerolineae bacterium]
MPENPPRHDTRAVRELLLSAFTADALSRFCQDHPLLRPIVDRFGPSHGLDDMAAEAIDYCKTHDLFDQLLAEVKDANPRQYARFESRLPMSAEALAEVPCPYRGLAAFDVQHAADYFGREVMVRRLLDKLGETSFVAVVGPSGCGKSSLVRAGMVPALRKGALPGSEGWQVEIFRPGDDPLRALALTLVHLLMTEATPVDRLAEARKLADHLGSGTLPLADVLVQIEGQYPDLSRLILIADQFEEAFTLCSDDALRRVFLETLIQAVKMPWVTVVLTLRADFFGRVLESERFGRRVDAGLVNVLPMGREERREAVEKPALRA